MRIVNIVVTGDLHQPVSLKELLQLGNEYRYDPDKSHRGYIQINSHTVAIYRTGKCLLLGIKRINSIDEIWNALVEKLSPFIDVAKVSKPAIKNLVATDNLNRKVNLVQIQKKFKNEDIEFEPEVFPGLIWRKKAGRILLFYSGKFVLTGVDTIDKLEMLKSDLYEKVESIQTES